MFINRSQLIQDNMPGLHYGIAVTDGDNDGAFEFLVAGFGTRNQLLKWDGAHYTDHAQDSLADAERQAIGIAAGDIDGDGYEELYILNTDTFAGRKTRGDRLFDFSEGRYIDLFDLPRNRTSINMMSGRSVVAVDRHGDERFGFFIANYAAPMRLYELDDDAFLTDVAPSAGVNVVTGGRGAIALPLVSEHIDIFTGNENGANFLFRNNGDGTFTDVALDVGIDDPAEHVRGIAVLDMGHGHLALVYGNWQGTHRMYSPSTDGQWDDIAPPALARPSRIRTVIAADFDNDGYQELFFNNIGEPNRLFGFRQGEWRLIDIGDAREPDAYGTGAAVADLDGDGRLELLIAHGEQNAQPLSLYHVPKNDNHWLRILPLTRYGAPARGATVTLIAGARQQWRVIDSGSGYLCQMEPVAHFGLSAVSQVDEVRVRWTDGTTHTLYDVGVDQLHRIPHPQA
ncbi:MAG: CRTAC1 family protein [Anaerolineae bacterium]